MSKNKDIPKYMIYDGRYRYDEDKAIVCECCDTLEEAIADAPDFGDCVVVNTDTWCIEWDSLYATEHKAMFPKSMKTIQQMLKQRSVKKEK